MDEVRSAASTVALKRVHVWVPGLSTAGGIQVYSAYFLRALAQVLPEAALSIYSKNDLQDRLIAKLVPSLPSGLRGKGEINLRSVGETRLRSFGHIPEGPRTPLFAARLIFDALRTKPGLIISTHLHFAPAARLVAKAAGIPYWVVAHGIEAWNIQSPRVLNGLSGADRILAVSHFTRSRLLEQFSIPPERVIVLPNTFLPTRFVPAPKPNHLLRRYGLTAQQPVILTVARLAEPERYKGYDRVLSALPAVRSAIPNVHYLLVGRGPDSKRIHGIIKQMGLEDCVTMTGFVRDEELCDHYNLCDVFAMPSKGEGFGIVYLEALACGRPVLAGNKDASAEPLLKGEIGILVDPDNVEHIASALKLLLQKTHPNKNLYVREYLRERVESEFGFLRFKRDLRALLEERFSALECGAPAPL